jgi:Mrp family chromosome partitioning ATPase
VLGAGENVSVSAEMFLDGRLESLMEYLEHNFDFIIMDTAPVNPAADAYILSEFCDLTLYVVRHRKTPKSFLRKLDETNEMKPLKRLCLVFNGIKPRGFIIKTKGYGYGSKHVPHNYRLLSKLTLRNKNGVAKKTYTPVKQL